MRSRSSLAPRLSLVRTFGLQLLAASVCLASNSLALADPIADSVADFSGTQGLGGWHYGYYPGPDYTPTGFQQMTQFTGGTWYVQAGTCWTQLWPNGGHPQGTDSSPPYQAAEQWAVRRWISSVDGDFALTGHLADLDGGTDSGSNGIIGHIFVDGSELYSHTIDNGDLTGVDYIIPISLNVGSILDIAIEPRLQNARYDSTLFTAQVVPEAGSIIFLGLGAATLLRRRRR
jgi:hypothetical protein